MTRFKVRFTSEAEADLLRPFDFLLEQDVAAAEQTREAIVAGRGSGPIDLVDLV